MTRIAIAQICSGIDPDANAALVESAIAEAAHGGAKILFTPEMTNIVDGDRKRASAVVTPEDGNAFLARVCAAAKAHGIWLALGSAAIRAADGKFHNRSYVIDDAGQVRATYDKMHLFDVDLATGESWRESNAYVPGEHPVVANTPAGPLGLAICYDLRFPALFAEMSRAGAQILSIPAAFTVPTGQAHWHVLQRARAIENACFLVCAAQSGTHEDGRRTYGHSLVIDPWGEILLDMGEGTGVGFAEIDLGDVEAVRQRVPVIAHRRAIPEAQRAS